MLHRVFEPHRVAAVAPDGHHVYIISGKIYGVSVIETGIG
jgi:hypothetical protein